MNDNMELFLRVHPLADGDANELAERTQRLRTQLLSLDVTSVGPLTMADESDGQKGLATVVGWLAVRYGNASGLRAVVSAVAGWTARTRHDVELTLGNDTLKVTGVTSEQQGRMIDAFLATHAPST